MSRKFLIDPQQLEQIWTALRDRGYVLLGPRVRAGDLVLDEVRTPDDLPLTWTDIQEPGSFRLAPRSDGRWFNFRVGQESLKKVFFPPEVRLWSARRQGAGWKVVAEEHPGPAYAFIGVRACDVAAVAVQDRIFLKGPYSDPLYQERRSRAFILAVNCTESGGTCFCASMGTGPRAVSGFDVSLTEVREADRHYFVAEAGSPRGEDLLAGLAPRPAGGQEVAAAEALVAGCAAQQRKVVETAGLKEFLYDNYENPHWEQVAARCLSCGNCALVCPTCFCHSIQDSLDVTGEQAERWRRWDVCFTVEHSYIHGGSIRPSPRARYRQWLTHKLATWQDQFGCLGCVGCGRCLTWCPVGIDLTEEVRALKDAARGSGTGDLTGEEEHGKP